MAELILVFIARTYFVSVCWVALTFDIQNFGIQWTWIFVALPALFRVCSIVNWMNDVLCLCFRALYFLEILCSCSVVGSRDTFLVVAILEFS